MPATVSIFKRDGYFAEGEGSAFNSSEGSTTVNGEEDVGEAGGEPLVELTLGAPEVDSGTGNTVFSLSAEEQVRFRGPSAPASPCNESRFGDVSTAGEVQARGATGCPQSLCVMCCSSMRCK